MFDQHLGEATLLCLRGLDGDKDLSNTCASVLANNTPLLPNPPYTALSQWFFNWLPRLVDL